MGEQSKLCLPTPTRFYFGTFKLPFLYHRQEDTGSARLKSVAYFSAAYMAVSIGEVNDIAFEQSRFSKIHESLILC